jgi:predicted double-glycine peptidase
MRKFSPKFVIAAAFVLTVLGVGTFMLISTEKKVPVIVNWFTRGRIDYPEEDVPDGHYSVVVGLDEEFIYLQDPEIGKLRKIEREDFMKVWFDFKGKYIDPNELIVRQLIAIEKK